VREKYVVSYERSEVQEEEMDKLRMGPFSMIPDTHDNRINLDFLRRAHQIIIAPFKVAERIIATRLRREARPHKILTGTDILHDYLDKEGSSLSLLEGFPMFHQLFILFGYYEADNKYVPSLITQLVGQRYKERKHIWVFLERDFETTASKWPAIANLNYIYTVKIESLEDLRQEKGPKLTHFQQSEKPHDTAERQATEDPKFRKKEKR